MRGLGGEQTTGIRINVFESFLQMHGGRTIEFVQYFVMRSLGQSHVEIDIGRDTVVQSSGCGGRTAPGEVCPDLFDIRLRTSLRGPFDNGDLQNPPDLLQIADVGTLHAPLHRLVPCRPAFDERPAPCCTFSNPMLAKIFTASRTVERPTPKIFINSDSVGNFPPTSNRPCAICSCNRTAISSANDLFRIVVSVLSIITSSDVCAKITDFSKIKKLFAYSNIVRIFTNTRSENMSPKAYTEQEEQLARFAKAMGHPARMAILRFLAGQDSCFFGDIHEVLPIAKATVSQHLKELKAAGLIQGEIEAPKVRYCINRENWAKARESFADFFCEYRKKGSCCG